MDSNRDTTTRKPEYLDLAYVQSITRDNMQMQQRILSVCNEEIRIQVDQLRHALDADQRDDITNLSHKLKSSFRLLGVVSAAEQLQQLENDSKAGNEAGDLRASWNAFLPLCNASLQELERLLEHY